jgi:nucleoside phosphorylase
MVSVATLIGAVKRARRTERYKILSGLYCLKAYEKPVTARSVEDLLNLHLRHEAPRKVVRRLPGYSPAVIIASKGPPLLWSLTPEGVEWLRQESGLALPTTNQNDEHDFDIGIVCALEFPEFAAVVEAVGGGPAWTEQRDARFPHVYREAALTTVDGTKLKLVGATATSMGLTAAAIVTTQLVMRYRPRIVAMVGIAAGTRQGKKQFGDILVADPSVDYASGKVAFEKGVRAFLPDPYPLGLNPRLRSVIQRYRGDHPVFSEIRSAWKGRVPATQNHLHLGPLGAADQVIDDSSRIIEIQKNWRKLIGVEMETYGVYRACHEAPDPKPRFVSFKAVCDFAAEKSDSWQEYAAFFAAQFTVRFFKNEWGALWPTQGGV